MALPNVRSIKKIVLLAIPCMLVCTGLGAQQFSHVLSFQGRLCGTDGKPLPDGVYSVQFLIYDEPSEGTVIWTDTQEVTQQGGVFSTYLGDDPAFPAGLFTHDRWLAMRVGEDAEMTPRVRFCAAPFAINADLLDGLDSTQFLALTPPVRLTGEIAHPDAVLTAENTGTGAGLKGISPSWGVLGISTTGTGVYGEGYATSCKGVEGFTGLGTAVYGYSESTGTGVWGQSDEGIGMHGYADTSYGVLGESYLGTAVRGEQLSSGNYGYLGTSNYGVQASGTIAGGAFFSYNSSSSAYMGSVNTGVNAFGKTVGGQFTCSNGTGSAALGYLNTGVQGYGTEAGGTFMNPTTQSRANLAYGQLGIDASGSGSGGQFQNLRTFSRACVANDDLGIDAYGPFAGGEFHDLNGSGEAYVAYDDYGIWAMGTDAAGIFEDLGSQSYAYVAKGDRGIEAEGAFAGGCFFGSTYGVESIGLDSGGFFADNDGTSIAYAASGGYGFWATSALTGGHFQHDSGNASANVATEWMGTYRGIEAFGTYTGGYFGCIGGSGEAHVGFGDTGIAALGDVCGGYFRDTSGSEVYVAYSSYKIQGTGSVSFVQNHPEEPDKVIVYACPEGDEVATYTRGTARLVDGRAVVPLGETFKWVTNPDIGLTAHLTPRGKAVPLAVVSLTTSELAVCGPEDGPQDLAFDYIVYGLRIGFEEVSIVQEKEREAYIPSMKDHRDLYERRPELRQYNAFERFAWMRAAAGESGTLDLSRSRALHDAIVEFDPATHGVAGPLDHREW